MCYHKYFKSKSKCSLMDGDQYVKVLMTVSLYCPQISLLILFLMQALGTIYGSASLYLNAFPK